MIFIRVDGANIKEIGTGHLYRMIFLADYIYQKIGISPLFVISGYPETKSILKRSNLKYFEINCKDETNEILKLSSSLRKDILIIDMMDREDDFIKTLVEKYIIVSFDDSKGGAKWSDVAINSVVGGPLNRKNYYGSKYFLIRPEIYKYHLRDKTISSSVKKIIICLGGSDPCSINLILIEWLKGLAFSGQVEWVLGSTVKGKDLIIERFKSLNLDITPIIDYKNIGKLYFDADLCISAAGFSLYEMACVGLPAITICLYPHQIPTAKKFEKTGAICNLGYFKDITEVHFRTALYELFNDQSQRYSMSRNGKTFVDGLGIERVMDKMNNLITIAGENK